MKAWLRQNFFSAVFALYDFLAITLCCLLILPLHFLLVLFGLGRRRSFRERAGFFPGPARSGRKRVFIHAVSAGEMTAAEPLIREIDSLDIEFVLTSGTVDGITVGLRLQKRVPSIVSVGYLPWDSRWLLSRWTRSCAPDLAVVMESEIWPGLYRLLKDRGIPLCLVNARIYEKDLGWYRRFRWIFREVLGAAAWIGVRSDAEKERFSEIGASPTVVEVVGDLKFEASISSTGSFSEKLKAELQGAGLVIVGGSTHPSEEVRLMACYQKLLRSKMDCKLVLAPRSLRRTDAVRREIQAFGARVQKVSDLEAGHSGWDVLILDEMGQLPAAYALAQIAFVGGSLIPWGGHNVMEAAALECAVVTGPYVGNFSEEVAWLEEAGGLLRLKDAGALCTELVALAVDVERRVRMAVKAREAVLSRKGIAERYALALKRFL